MATPCSIVFQSDCEAPSTNKESNTELVRYLSFLQQKQEAGNRSNPLKRASLTHWQWS